LVVAQVLPLLRLSPLLQVLLGLMEVNQDEKVMLYETSLVYIRIMTKFQYLIAGLLRSSPARVFVKSIEECVLPGLGLEGSIKSSSQSVLSIGLQLTKSNCTLFLFIILFDSSSRIRFYTALVIFEQ